MGLTRYYFQDANTPDKIQKGKQNLIEIGELVDKQLAHKGYGAKPSVILPITSHELKILNSYEDTSGIVHEEIKEMVEEKIEALSSLVSEETALRIIAQELGINLKQ